MTGKQKKKVQITKDEIIINWGNPQQVVSDVSMSVTYVNGKKEKLFPSNQ